MNNKGEDVQSIEDWKIELKKQQEEVDEEVGPILIGALERAKEKYCKRHGITKEEYDREGVYSIYDI